MKNVERTTLTITDAVLTKIDGTQSPLLVGTRTALLNLCVVLRAYGLDAELESDELDTVQTLTICTPEVLELYEKKAAKGGRPKRGTWPEGLDTDEQRLAWLDSVPVEEAMQVLGVSKSTVYRRIDALTKSVRKGF